MLCRYAKAQMALVRADNLDIGPPISWIMLGHVFVSETHSFDTSRIISAQMGQFCCIHELYTDVKYAAG